MYVRFIDWFTPALVCYTGLIVLLVWYLIPLNKWAYFILFDILVTSIAVVLWQFDVKWPLQRVFSTLTGVLGFLHGIALGCLTNEFWNSEFVWVIYILDAMYLAFGGWLGSTRPKRGFLEDPPKSKLPK